MALTQTQTRQALSLFLFATVLTQVAYTALYVADQNIPRQWLWGIEGVVFVLLATLAGSALAQSKAYTLGYSALLVSGILNVVQVGVGYTQFGPFTEVSQQMQGLGPMAASVVAFSFFVYNAAKTLIGLATVLFGLVILKSGAKALGGLSMVVGVAAFAANALTVVIGRVEVIPAGATGVLATLLLAVCLLRIQED